MPLDTTRVLAAHGQALLALPEPETAPDDHPEPELLATSVGRVGGRIIPSLSAISLLSLNSPLDKEKEGRGVEGRGEIRPADLREWRRRAGRVALKVGLAPLLIPGRVPVPDLPSLGPTSIGNSPSRLWLSTPPRGTRIERPAGVSLPVLIPVQLPAEGMPMTPLRLDEGDYFVSSLRTENIDEAEEYA